MKKALSTLAICLLSVIIAQGQIFKPVKWSYAAKKTGANTAVVFFKATIDEGWHIYGLNIADGGPVKTSFTFTPSAQFSLDGPVVQPTPITRFEKSFNMNVSFFEKEVIFKQKIKLKAGQPVVKGHLEYMTCNDQRCLPPEQIDFAIPVK